MTARMPARGDRSAPSFDPAKPRSLKHYFTELEYLLADASVTSEAGKKRYAIRYVDFEIADIWETLPEYSNAAKTFSDFKKAIEELYPDADEEYKYTLSDLEQLVVDRQRLGMQSLADLAEYHSQFMAITTFLISKARLSEIEQKRIYVRGFPASVWSKISQRLQLKLLDHLPDEPYKVTDVQAAARFVLHGTHSTTALSTTSSATSSTSPTTLDSLVKPEHLAPLFTEFTKTIIEVIRSQTRPQSSSTTSSSTPQDVRCNFCGKGHFIRNCELVEEYLRAGKLKRNIEGKVVLPTGVFVPREIQVPSNLLKERIDEWHRRNPGQLATATISAGTMLHAISTVSEATSAAPISPSAPKATYQLTSEDRIALLEAELFNLRTRGPGFVPQVRTRAQKARASIPEEDRELSVPEAPSTRTQPPVSQAPSPPSQTLPDVADTTTTTRPTPYIEEEPEHPFREALDANYLPPQHRNVAAPYKPSPKKNEPAYRTQAPIQEDSTASTVFNRSLDASITLTQRELLSIAPDVRTHYKDITTVKRNPSAIPQAQTNILDIGTMPSQPTFNISVPKSTPIAASVHRSPPEGATIIPDPYEQYIRSLRPGEEPDQQRLYATKDSASLRTICPIIDNSHRIECILDSGSQIIAMSEAVCHELALVYDPTIKLNMQSANGTVDQSLGLARNVPFRLGNLTFYMQVHIIRAPAYDVLLGRPFDILTESVVRNYQNEEQTITVSDPNTRQTATIPTSTRRPPRFSHSSHPDFH